MCQIEYNKPSQIFRKPLITIEVSYHDMTYHYSRFHVTKLYVGHHNTVFDYIKHAMVCSF